MTSKDTKIEFLYLSEEDLIKSGVLEMNTCVETMDKMFGIIGDGDYLMGGPKENEHGIMLWFPEEKRFENMPVAGPDRRFMSLISYLGGDFNIVGEKWYGSNISNKDKGLPRSILTVTLSDVDTGQPLAFMSGNLISAMRTGAVPGVATRYLAHEDAKVLAVVGTGVINKACVQAVLYAKQNIETIKVFDIDPKRSQAFIDGLQDDVKTELEVSYSMEACIRDADIVSVATSGAKRPEIKDEWVKDGCLITLTGTAKLSENFYKENTIVADNWEMHEAWYRDALERPNGMESITSWAPTGDILKMIHDGNLKDKVFHNLGDIVLGGDDFRKCEKEKIVFVTGGLSTEDTAWAYHVYKNALKNSIGQKLKLWDQPYWA
ncbi:tyramine oxidase subunit B [Pseudogracilibacillus sp. SO30301A]|uniref:tyramine oxidase subunit B n=1 Tax=Pseudogracilibacillus sp. SO30301A TaxID=3098291 RepID=UPI00300E552E